MDKTAKYIILVLVFIALMAGAVVAYNFISEKFEPEVPALPTEPASTPAHAETAVPDDSGEAEPEPTDAPEIIYAPDFTVLGMDGVECSLSDSLGKSVIVNFWATWCGPCKSEMPAFDKLYEEYGDEIDFMMVNLTDGQDTEEKVRSFIEENGYSFPVYMDTTLYAAMTYGAYSIPATVFIDPEGIIVYAQMGAMDEEFLRSVIEELLLKGE